MGSVGHVAVRMGRGVGAVLRLIRRLFPSSHYVLLSLLFVVGLELIFALQRFVLPVAITVVVVMIFGVVVLRLEERGVFRPTQFFLPVLATTGLSGFAFFLPTTSILHAYIAAAGLILFFLLKHGARQAYPLWNWWLSLIVYYLNIAFILGLRFHLYMPILVMLLLTWLVTALMTLQALRRVTASTVEALLPVMGMTFVLTEAVWVLQFLPAHYLVQAAIVATIYYVMFNLVSVSYTRRLARRDVVEYVGIGMVALLIITVSAQWQ